MEIRTASKASAFGRHGGRPVKNQVCIYWLEGRCSRNPCKFLHRESMPSHNDLYSKKTKTRTWRNQDRDVSKRSANLSNGKPNTISDRDILRKVLTYNGKSGHKDTAIDVVKTVSLSQEELNVTTAVRDEPVVKTVSLSQEELNVTTSVRDEPAENIVPKVKTVSLSQEELNVATSVRDEPAENIVPKAPPKQCKYWATGNCVHGEKCKDLHSWFCGSGFTMLTKLEGHTKAITGISQPSGCEKLYSGSQDGTVRVWDCYTGQSAGSVMIDGEVGCLVGDGPLLFTAFQNVVKVCNLQNQCEFSLTGPVESICSMVVDEDKFYAGTQDGAIMVWKWNLEANIPEPAAMLKEHKGAVCSLVIRAGKLYSGSRDCTIKVWDLQNLQCLQTLYDHKRDVTSLLCWENYLISASLDKTLKVWSATESGAMEVFNEIKEDHELMALCGINDAEGKPILLCSLNDSTVRLYDLPSFTERGRIFSEEAVQVIRLGNNGLFFTGDAKGEVSVWRMLEAPRATPS